MKSVILLAFLVGAVFAAAIDDNDVSNSLFYLKIGLNSTYINWIALKQMEYFHFLDLNLHA